jgi:hypothetical protein
MQDIHERFPAGLISLGIDGPPTYVGHRLMVTGNPDGFRWIAQVLLKMAESVDDPASPANIGWHLLLNEECAPPLRMEQEWFLSLNCESNKEV